MRPARRPLDGVSLVPLLKDPNRTWDQPALTTCLGNHALRDERWRYIRYADGGEELYDHQNDPNEWTNLADRPEFAAVKGGLARVAARNGSSEPEEEGEETEEPRCKMRGNAKLRHLFRRDDLNVAPQSVEQLWAGYDPRSVPLEASTTPNFNKRSKTPFDESRSTATAKPSRPLDHF